MRRSLVGWMALLCGALSFAAPVSAASAHVNILDLAMTLTPNATDYGNDYIEITGASGMRVQLWTNSPTGMALYVQCTDAAPAVALADFLVRTGTPPGSGGTSLNTYTAISATSLALWSSGAMVAPWGQVNVDIRIKNLYAYPGGPGGGTTNYTDNLTFTVLVQ